MRTNDISKALCTARAALDAGNTATFRRAARYAAGRLGMVACLDLAPEMAWRLMNAACMAREDQERARRAAWAA